jgi:hypothetical protein
MSWIPISEKTPVGVLVLVLYEDDAVYPLDWDDRVALLTGYNLDNPELMKSVTHWMALEPPGLGV